MKKALSLVLALMMILSLAACGQRAAEKAEEPAAEPAPVEEPAEEPADEPRDEPEEPVAEPMAGMPNPMTEYGSLEEINELAGSHLVHPPVMGVSDEAFFTISGGEGVPLLAQYTFTVAGVEYCFRSANRTEDISGIYVGDGTAFEHSTAPDGVELVEGGDYHVARWFGPDGWQYVLSAGSEADSSIFAGVADELCNVVAMMSESAAVSDPLNLAGEYQDEWSMRAIATVEQNGSEFTISVHWGDSAASAAEWTMTARMEDGLLKYSDCREMYVTYAADGSFTEEPVDFPAEGYFELKAGKLLWTGAGDEQCAQCVFARPAF